MSEIKKWTGAEMLLCLLAIGFVLLLHGAVPFLMVPTDWQAMWAAGFAQSYANGPLFTIYAHDIGIPNPAAIAFGLSGTWPTSLFIRLGWLPVDAYSAMVALWLALAMYSAYQISRRFGASRTTALLGGVAWLSMPIVWVHAGYSMLSLGIALLPFYFLVAIKLFLIENTAKKISILAMVLYAVAAIVSVFMDGYTFMMFATGASILLLSSLWVASENRSILVKYAVPTHIVSFALAYYLYSVFIGKSEYPAQQLTFFRSMGVDLSYMVIPTKGIHLVADLLGLSIERSHKQHFGDSSIWTSAFCLPVLIFGMIAFCCIRGKIKIVTGFMLVALFGFYMALGPSLKINSLKPEESFNLTQSGDIVYSMTREYAIMPTGNGWISEKLPGFNVMRASYRWLALGCFALWLLILLNASRADEKWRQSWCLALIGLILINIPDLPRWKNKMKYRDIFHVIDSVIVEDLREHTNAKEKALFVPWGNDFVATYLAPRAGIKSANIGGDKNLNTAKVFWPSGISVLGPGANLDEADHAWKFLVDRDYDVLILPYFNMTKGGKFFKFTRMFYPDIKHSSSNNIYNNQTEEYKKTSNFINNLKKLSFLDVRDARTFVSVRLRPEFSSDEEQFYLRKKIMATISYPIIIGKGLGILPLLGEGWHSLEDHHIWSSAAAKLKIPVPEECETRHCEAVLNFVVYGSSPQRPIKVVMKSDESSWQWEKQIVATGGSIKVAIPVFDTKGWQDISVSVPSGTSPLALQGGSDNRVLGIALQRIELEK